jgi:hypothetical protein
LEGYTASVRSSGQRRWIVIGKGHYGKVHQHMDSEIHDRADCYLAVRVICKGACCAYALIVRFFFF